MESIAVTTKDSLETAYLGRSAGAISATPNRAFFLYDGFSAEIGEWVERYLPELNDRSGEYLDIYDYTITNHKAEGVHAASRNIASRLSPIPNSSWDEIYSAGLPSILIWSDRASGILPIGPLASNPRKMQKFFDMLITCVKGGPINAWHFDELETYINEHSEIEKVLDQQRKAATPCDVFVSYRRSDRAYVEVLARILTSSWSPAMVQASSSPSGSNLLRQSWLRL